MTTEGRDDKDGMDPRDDEALWALLGRQTPRAQVSPYFSRRVLREVTLAEQSRAGGWWARLRQGVSSSIFPRQTALWSGVLSGACALGLFLLSNQGEVPKTIPSPRTELALTQPSPAQTPAAVISLVEDTADDAVTVDEVEVIADLDNILQREESRLWTDDTARF